MKTILMSPLFHVGVETRYGRTFIMRIVTYKIIMIRLMWNSDDAIIKNNGLATIEYISKHCSEVSQKESNIHETTWRIQKISFFCNLPCSCSRIARIQTRAEQLGPLANQRRQRYQVNQTVRQSITSRISSKAARSSIWGFKL